MAQPGWQTLTAIAPQLGRYGPGQARRRRCRADAIRNRRKEPFSFQKAEGKEYPGVRPDLTGPHLRQSMCTVWAGDRDCWRRGEDRAAIQRMAGSGQPAIDSGTANRWCRGLENGGDAKHVSAPQGSETMRSPERQTRRWPFRSVLFSSNLRVLSGAWLFPWITTQ